MLRVNAPPLSFTEVSRHFAQFRCPARICGSRNKSIKERQSFRLVAASRRPGLSTNWTPALSCDHCGQQIAYWSGVKLNSFLCRIVGRSNLQGLEVEVLPDLRAQP